jgi:transcriptional regulator with XRE-family HTH domain
MNSVFSTSTRFRNARERAGLSVAETAARAGVPEACVWDLESYDDELMTAYSAADLRRFAAVLSVAPRELLGTDDRGAPVSPDELALAIRAHCQARGMTSDAFGEAAGWDVSKAVNSPQMLLTDFSIDGVRDICRELGIQWQRIISGLTADA